jgi:hypothetical protein
MDLASFGSAVTTLREAADGRRIEPTWGGIALVGRDGDELDRLRGERRTRGRSMDLWQGTVEDLRAFADGLAHEGATWLVVQPVGGDDRIDVVAEALRS